MKLFLQFAIRLFVVITVGLGLFFLGFNAHATPKAPVKEWTLPANFEYGGGAFAIGCSFWEPPILHPYSSDNPNLGFAELGFSDDQAGVRGVLAVIDGPNGMATLMGSHCAISVDWSAFPTENRPSPKLPAPNRAGTN